MAYINCKLLVILFFNINIFNALTHQFNSVWNAIFTKYYFGLVLNTLNRNTCLAPTNKKWEELFENKESSLTNAGFN